jgi:hypothetical protein
MAEATSFLARARLVAPCAELSNLLETHLISHTARAAVQRCKTLSGYNDLERAARDALANFTASLSTSAEDIGLRTYATTRLAFLIALLALAIAFWDSIIGSSP